MTHRLVLASILLLPTLAAAQAADPCAQTPQTCATLINTHATARTRIPNTAVDVALSIVFNDKDLPTVQRTVGAKSEALLKYLRSQNVQRLITTNVSFKPEIKYEKSAPNKTVGYNGILRISFRTTPDKAPDVLTGVLSNGATSIDNTTFIPTEEEIAATRRQLSADATKTAMALADSIATAAGMHVISIRQINVDTDSDESRDNSARSNNYSVIMGAGGGPQPTPDTETASGDRSLAITVDLVAAAAH